MKPAAEEEQKRQALMMAVREAAEQALSTQVAEELWDMGLGRRFEGPERALRGDLPEQVESLRVTRKDGMHAVRATQRVYDTGQA